MTLRLSRRDYGGPRKIRFLVKITSIGNNLSMTISDNIFNLWRVFPVAKDPISFRCDRDGNYVSFD